MQQMDESRKQILVCWIPEQKSDMAQRVFENDSIRLRKCRGPMAKGVRVL